MKPSEENSIVPKALRDMFRKYKEREREEKIMRERENTPTQKPSSKEDSEALKELIESPTKSKGPAKSVSQDVLESMRAQQPPSSRQPAGGTLVLGAERFMTQPPQFRESDNFTQPYAKGEVDIGGGSFAKGGLVKKKMGGTVKKTSKVRSHRGDGICQRGFTKGRMY